MRLQLLLDDIIEASKQIGETLISNANNSQMTTTLLLIILCLISLISGIVFCTYITKSITAPLK